MCAHLEAGVREARGESRRLTSAILSYAGEKQTRPDKDFKLSSKWSYLSWPVLALLMEWRMLSTQQPHVYRKRHQNTKPRAMCVNSQCALFSLFSLSFFFFKLMKASGFRCVLPLEQKHQWDRLNDRVQWAFKKNVLHIIPVAYDYNLPTVSQSELWSNEEPVFRPSLTFTLGRI